MKTFTTLFTLLISSLILAQNTASAQVDAALPRVNQNMYPEVEQNPDGDLFTNGEDFLRVSDQATPTDPVARISVFPNPATTFVRVVLGGVSSAEVFITDMRGNVVMEKRVEGQDRIDVRFKVSHLPSGFYLVAVKHKGRNQFARFVIR